MNRRKKKKPQSVDYVSVLKEKYSSIDWTGMKEKVVSQWNVLPKLHQRALMVVVPVVLLLLVIPFPQQQSEAKDPKPQRVAIDINATGLSGQQSTDENSSPLRARIIGKNTELRAVIP